ncbi:hypothetical protein ZIOFF_067118 [Zingiber officinale]|uniref:Wound-responsive family protein n=2 Tax=Zingiber officinale TaxID=94328 RepID=A0A8J5C8U8_ZINOF|nr:hypothetical protein ZIOFF_067118 [Zingiber officinale]
MESRHVAAAARAFSSSGTRFDLNEDHRNAPVHSNRCGVIRVARDQRPCSHLAALDRCFLGLENQNQQREYSIKSFALVLHPATASCFSRRIENVERIMASVKKASILVAASVGAVEALKDQAGLCRWNYALRSLQQHAKSNMRSLSQAVRMSSAVSDGRCSERAKQSEESLRKVMYLTCWGPN